MSPTVTLQVGGQVDSRQVELLLYIQRQILHIVSIVLVLRQEVLGRKPQSR
jgi:hypothetical protein